MAGERTPTQARQGETGRSMLGVLTISILLAAVLAIGGYFILFATPNEEAAAPIPSVGTTTENATAASARGDSAAPADPAGAATTDANASDRTREGAGEGGVPASQPQ